MRRNKNQNQNQNNKITSSDIPLDFSFRNIKMLEQILNLKPHHGKRKPIHEPQDNKNKLKQQPKLLKQSNKIQSRNEEQPLEKTLETKLQIIRVIQVSNSITNQIQNLNVKSKNQPIKETKKIQEIELQPCSLYLSYNKLRSIKNFYNIVKQVFMDIRYLKWIDLSHNLLVTLDDKFQQLKQLKTLYLHCNYIKDFSQLTKLKHLSELRSITIYGNPLENHSNCRNILIGILEQIHKIDSALVTKREIEISTYYWKQMNFKKLPVITNAQKPKSESSEGQDN